MACGPPAVRVPIAELDAALAGLDRDVRAALEVAIERARAVHADQRRTDSTTDAGSRRHRDRAVGPGRAGGPVRARRQRGLPVQRGDERGAGPGRRGRLAGGGQPAAGARRPFAGLPHPTILAAARLLGVDEVWAVGGAQAVALLAYGGADTDGAELTPVDMITGPGNIYVTAAKRLCRSRVGIDAEAGPTEIAILADYTADPVHVAADLISQAEHDEMAASVLVTPSTALADAADTELGAQLQTTVHRERVDGRAEPDGSRRSSWSTTPTPGIRVVNAYAAEHLEIQTADAAKVAGPDPFGRRHLRRPVFAGQPGRLLRRLQPRAADRGQRRGTPAACRCRPSCAASTSSTTPRRR